MAMSSESTKGIIHYTVGQRKGLGLAMGHPVFVTEIRPDTNEVVIGENADVFASKLYANKLNFMAAEAFTGDVRAKPKSATAMPVRTVR